MGVSLLRSDLSVSMFSSRCRQASLALRVYHPKDLKLVSGAILCHQTFGEIPGSDAKGWSHSVSQPVAN